MSIQQDFRTALGLLLPQTPDLAVVNSSLWNLMPPPSFQPNDILVPLMEVAEKGWTLAFAAYTFDFCRTGRFVARGSRSETGLLADWIREEIPGAVRMRHPIYSYMLFGPRAVELSTCCSPSTAFGEAGPFGFFEKVDAWQIGLGGHFYSQFHRYEETEHVPYRYFKTFPGYADWGDGNGDEAVATSMYVRDLRFFVENDVTAFVELLTTRGDLHSVPLWRDSIHRVRTRKLAEACKDLLAKDTFALLSPQSAEAAREFYAKEDGHER
jgi:aminoglycoside N3'-acetyltransferase